jgi:hypothetical protein
MDAGEKSDMRRLKPKEQHERLLANADREQIVQHLSDGADQEVTRIAVTLARECTLFVHFKRLWALRVEDLDERLYGEQYMKNIFVNRRALYRQLSKPVQPG